MTDKNEIAADSSPDSDFTNQWCVELSEYLKLDAKWYMIKPMLLVTLEKVAFTLKGLLIQEKLAVYNRRKL
ncbi:unnamed protein product [Lupinus luteus]|uniref:Uncharacterized protein n=1 Tax=Lupinus luteus TaxID=3873 RepID=A0AAV1Y1A3_LUPLU